MTAKLHLAILIVLAGCGAWALIEDAISTLWPHDSGDLDHSYDDRDWMDM